MENLPVKLLRNIQRKDGRNEIKTYPYHRCDISCPFLHRPATSPVIKNAEVKAGKETVRTNIRQEQQVKAVARANQPNVAESSSNHKKSTVQKTQVNGKSARKTVTKHSEKGRKK